MFAPGRTYLQRSAPQGGERRAPQGQNGPAGPSLYGVVGRRPASAPGFTYSAAMASRSEQWSVATLDWYLLDPPARVPGTYMAFSGLRNDGARAAVICFLGPLD